MAAVPCFPCSPSSSLTHTASPYARTDFGFIITHIFYQNVPLTQLQQWSPNTNETADGPPRFQSQKSLGSGMARATSASTSAHRGPWTNCELHLTSKLRLEASPASYHGHHQVHALYPLNSGQDPPKINTKYQRWKMGTELQAYKDSSRMLTINQMFPMFSESRPWVKSNISTSCILQGFTSLSSPICGPVCKSAQEKRQGTHGKVEWQKQSRQTDAESPKSTDLPTFWKKLLVLWASRQSTREREKVVGQLLCPLESKSHGFQPKSLANKAGHYHLCSRLKHIFVWWLLCEMEIIRLMLSYRWRH